MSGEILDGARYVGQASDSASKLGVSSLQKVSSTLERVVDTAHVHVVESLYPAGGEAMHAVHHRVFPPFDTAHFASHLFWLTLSFGLFYFVVSWIILPRIGNVIDIRRNLIRDDLELAEESKKSADAMILHYEQILQETRQKARNIVDQSMQKARMEAQEKRQELEDSLRKQLAESRIEIESARARAFENIHSSAFDVTREMLEKLLHKKMNDHSVKQAISAVQALGQEK